MIDEVLTNVREAFLDEGYDEQLLQELKQVIFIIKNLLVQRKKYNY